MLIAREVKAIWRAVPEIFAGRAPAQLWQWLFLAPDGKPHRAGAIVLADLRGFAFLDGRSVFDPDPVVMARRVGRQEVALRIINYLNLDEQAVQQLMEIDDGIE